MKKIFILLFVLVIGFGFMNVASAATATMKVSSSNSNLVVGNSFTVTVSVSASAPMANWEFNLNYDTSKLTLVKSDDGLHVLGLDMTQNKKTATYTYTFKAKASGSASISLGASSVLGWDKSEMNLNKTSSTVNIVTQQQVEESFSKNDYLSDLSIEGYELSPKFNKNTLEYSVTLPPLSKEINVNATKEDNKAKINGTGKMAISDGNNQVKVTVTAQKGNVRTYVINVKVEELQPINVKVGDKDYSVIRFADALPTASRFYEATTVKINEQDIPGYISKVTDFTLIGLKDSEGNVDLYIYNNETYTKYREFNFNQSALYIMEPDSSLVPFGFEKITINLGNEEIMAYQNKNQTYPLIYGLNMETGEKNFYRYDSKENTLQRFSEIKDDEKQLYFYAIIGLFSLLTITYIIIIITTISNNKKKKIKLENTIKLSKSEIEDFLPKKETKKDLKKKKNQNKKKEKIEDKINKKEFLKNDEVFKEKALPKKEIEEKRESLLSKTMVDITNIKFNDEEE